MRYTRTIFVYMCLKRLFSPVFVYFPSHRFPCVHRFMSSDRYRTQFLRYEDRFTTVCKLSLCFRKTVVTQGVYAA